MRAKNYTRSERPSDDFIIGKAKPYVRATGVSRWHRWNLITDFGESINIGGSEPNKTAARKAAVVAAREYNEKIRDQSIYPAHKATKAECRPKCSTSHFDRTEKVRHGI